MSMPPIRATRWAPSIDQLTLIAGSRLSRHITEIEGECASSLEGLRLLADRMPWIQRRCFFRRELGDCEQAASALSRLRQLRFLQVVFSLRSRMLTIEWMDQQTVAANHLIRAALHAAARAVFAVSHVLRRTNRFAPLTELAHLRKFIFAAQRLLSTLPSDEQVAALRRMHSLQQFDHSFTDRNGTLRLLPQAPIPPVRWRLAHVASSGADLGPSLRLLSDLTELDMRCVCGDMSFLLSLPRVVKLDVNRSWKKIADLPADDRVRILTTPSDHRPRSGSPRVHVRTTGGSACRSAAAFCPFPQFAFGNDIAELPCDRGTDSIAHLSLSNCPKVPSAEVVHLLGMRSLRRLSIDVKTLQEPLSEAQMTQLRAVHPFVLLCG